MIKIYNLFNFILGSLIALPLYFKFFSLTPELINISLYLFIPGEKLIPIAFYCIAIFIFISSIRLNIEFITPFLLVNFLLAILLSNIPFNRFIALIIPLNLIYYLSTLIRKKYAPLHYLCKGYLIGVFLIYLFNIISAIIFYPYMGNIFGFEIYGFYVAYPSVGSMVCGSSFLSLLCLKNKLNNISILLTLLTLSSFIIIIFPQRRMALVDLTLIMLCTIIYISINFFRKKLNIVSLTFIPLTILLISICLSNIYSPISTIADGRLISYIRVFEFLKTDNIYGFFFGYKEGFADYSNLFLELFVRSGIVGFLAYFISFFLVINFYFKTLQIDISKLDISIKIPLLFIMLSLLFGNIANINLSLPYFSINFVMILLSYKYLIQNFKLDRVPENITN